MMKADQNIVELHTDCFACSQNREDGLELKFKELDEVSVVGEICINRRYQGYNGYVHGGVIATILDAAMTHCLLRKGIPAMTAKLNIRYKRPLLLEKMTEAFAQLEKSRSPIYELKSSIMQDGKLIASASATFMRNEAAMNRVVNS